MLFSVLSVVLVAAPAAVAEPVAAAQILVMELESDKSVEPGIARTLTDLITTHVSQATGFQALSSADLENLVALEGEKQAMGCDTSTACLSDIAGALGARFVVFGRVSTLGDLLVVNLSLIDAERAAPVKRSALQADNLEEVGGRIREAVDPLLDEARGLLGQEGGFTTAVAEDEADVLSWMVFAGAGTAAAGVVVAGLAGTAAVASGYVYFTQNSAPVNVRAASPVGIAGGAAASVIGVVLVGAGAATLAFGLWE